MNGFHKAHLEKYHYLFYEVPSSIPYVYYRCQYHPGSTQRSLMSYFHLLLFLLHFAALPFSFLDSVLTYIELCALCSPSPELLDKFFPSQELSFLFIGATYCFISNFQVGPDSLHFGETLYPPTSKLQYHFLPKPYHSASYLLTEQLPSPLSSVSHELRSWAQFIVCYPMPRKWVVYSKHSMNIWSTNKIFHVESLSCVNVFMRIWFLKKEAN